MSHLPDSAAAAEALTLGIEGENALELNALLSFLDLAGGFALAFARTNHPSQTRTLADALRAARPERRLVDVALAADGPGIVSQLVDAALGGPDGPPDALLVGGVEDFLDVRREQSPAMTALNLSREHLARHVRLPVVFWVPDHAAAAFVRQAPDLWSYRSGTFAFSGTADDVRASASHLAAEGTWNLTPAERAARRTMLAVLIREAAAIGEPARSALADALDRMGDLLLADGDANDAIAHYQDALPIYRQIGARLGEAGALQALGDAARMQDRYADAIAHYQDALPIYRQIGARLGEAGALKALGDAARMQARYADAIAHYQDALPIYRQIGDRLGEANSLIGMARLARAQRAFDEAGELAQDAFFIYEDIGARLGMAIALEEVAIADEAVGQWAEARDGFERAHDLFDAVGLKEPARRAREQALVAEQHLADQGAV